MTDNPEQKRRSATIEDVLLAQSEAARRVGGSFASIGDALRGVGASMSAAVRVGPDGRMTIYGMDVVADPRMRDDAWAMIDTETGSVIASGTGAIPPESVEAVVEAVRRKRPLKLDDET